MRSAGGFTALALAAIGSATAGGLVLGLAYCAGLGIPLAIAR